MLHDALGTMQELFKLCRVAACFNVTPQAPQPSDHVSTVLEAGERVFQTFFYGRKQCFMHVEEHNRFSMHFLASNHYLEHVLAPPSTGLRGQVSEAPDPDSSLEREAKQPVTQRVFLPPAEIITQVFAESVREDAPRKR